MPVAGQLVDSYGRVHDYLRIAVTDRCNLRCVYCMPAEGMTFEPDHRILSYEEIAEIVETAAALGIRKLRITGGEPLVRKGLDTLIAMLAAIPGIEDIALTTNGIFLAPFADRLRAAGLTRVNISLDSLRADRFAMITRGGDVSKVLAGLRASQLAGFSPIKLNVVLMKGINDDEVEDFLRMTIEEPIQIRFIEYMPIGHEDNSWRAGYMPLDYVLETCRRLGLDCEPAKEVYGNGPAQSYRIAGAAGTFGLIHPVSDHFCGSCNRLRLTADGSIKPCLYWSDEYNMRGHLGNPSALAAIFQRALGSKPETHEMARALAGGQRSQAPTARRMSQIGG
ncbi:GTP 3',8-cyclase MoaA [Paenibacillus oenotherae]|uniref:GTP 3',8-cyclase n=1 Tax=Paenibacillus oenotherae TaxID=1435645 RepID=A0ABS7D5K9_9BACL|nr:GTP 3',8-cyclase MoaA [Paenibacillus oenotherae]MBW7475232.1 GTP 3',8-cyclase MoaA [Paenibacillus oenotherae]